MGSPRFPEPPPSIPATELRKIDTLVDRLADRKDAWVKLGFEDRIKYLDKLQDGVQRHAAEWAKVVCQAVGLDANSPEAGEAWIGGPMTTARNIRLLKEALQEKGQPKLPKWSKKHGRDVAHVFPANTIDKLMFAGFEAEVWIEQGKPATQGRIYREKKSEGKVSLVLGAGNVSSIGPMDALYKLFVEDEVVVLKMNPVNEYLGPVIEKAFQCLVDDGYFGVVYGGAEVGQHLTAHEKIDTIHITGSNRTHDAIIWGGTVEEQEKNKAAGTPVVTKPISSELGCVTPVMIVPGPWSDKEIAFQAAHVASMVAHNASFNCNAAKVLVVAKDWPLKDKFVKAVHQALSDVPARKAYYPGALQRYQGFLDKYPQAEALGDTPAQDRGDQTVVPWTVIPDVAAEEGEYALTNEAFCGVLAEVEVEGDDAGTFLKNVVPFVNDKVWGTLSCMMLIHPESERAYKKEFDEAIRDLRYGGIGINAWAGVLYGLVVTTWGAYPGHPLEDIRSGRGVVHNTYLLDHPEKSIVRAPFVIKPTPAWFATHKNLKNLGAKLTAFEAAPSLFKLPSVVGSALKG